VPTPPRPARARPQRTALVRVTAALLTVAALLVPCSGPAAAASGSPRERAAVADRYEREILDRVNAIRRDAGRSPLAPAACARGPAQDRAAILLRTRRLVHEPLKPVLRGCRSARRAAENLATSPRSGSPADVVDVWMRSRAHRAALLDRRYTTTAVSVSVGRDGRWAVSQVFLGGRGRR
jgi:uncharacterized protein YkwD